jgi:hypothetical protein
MNIFIRGGLFILIMAGMAGSSFAKSDIDPFYGQYIGNTNSKCDKNAAPRNLDVIIRPYKRGFTVEWTTTIHKPSGKTKQANFSINFKSMGKGGLYRSAMRVNAFGHEVPNDPLQGAPYIWSVLSGKTLTVHSLMIFGNGDYEIQTYIRTLTRDGMDVVFSRIRNGEKKKNLCANLKRIKY